MLLALDVGNTNVTIGAFDGARLAGRWRLSTVHEQTADEWGILMRNLFALSSLDLARVDGIVVASVVPPLDSALAQMARDYFGTAAMFVTSETDTGLRIRYDNPREVGADRIVNALAAFHRYGGPVVVIDFGTATTYDVVSDKGEFLGGVIAPGLQISNAALSSSTARLPQVELHAPKAVVGRNTVESIQSALIYGTAAEVDGLVGRIREELGAEAKVVATGGLAPLIAPYCSSVDEHDEWLTLEGLRLVFERNVGPTDD